MVRRLIQCYLFIAVAVVANGFFATPSLAGGGGDCGFRVANPYIEFAANAGAIDVDYVYIVNTSDGQITVKASTNGSTIFLTESTSFTLQKGDSAAFKVSFVGPNMPGGTVKTGTLFIINDASNCKQTVSLSGTVGNSSGGGNTDSLILDPSSVNFGAVMADSEACRTLYLTNKGTSAVTITSWSACENNESVTATSSFGASGTIAAGEDATFTVCYKPDNANTQIGCKLIIHALVNGVEKVIYASISGYLKTSGGGTTGELKADPSSISFGAIPAGTEKCKTITLFNKGTESITIVGVTPCDDASVTMASTLDSGRTLLEAGKSVTITICYKPSANTQLGCKLLIAYLVGNSTSEKTMSIGISGYSGTNTTKESCLKFEQGSGWKDPIIIGSSADRTITITNPTSMPVIINYDSLACQDIESFKMNGTYPMTIDAGATITVGYTFTPQNPPLGTTKEKYYVCLLLNVSGDSIDCKFANTYLYGYVQGKDGKSTTNDSVVRPLFPDEKRVIAINSTATNATKTFYFTNNLTVNATIKSVRLEDGSFFSIVGTDPSSLPATIATGGAFSVTVAYTATDNLLHKDKLIIEADHALTSSGEFELQGASGITADVNSPSVSAVEIFVSPNPASTTVTASMKGVHTATVEVYDMLGSLLSSSSVGAEWNWNLTGSQISAGNYILRFSGIGSDGIPFVQSKQLKITK